jgi:RND superfamily putative drug exporter
VVGAPRGSPGLTGYAHGLERLPGVTAAHVRTAGRQAVVVVGLRPRPGSVAAQRSVRAIRVTAAPLSLEVGGESATTLDARERFRDRLPLVAVLIVALVFAAATLAGRSPPLAGGLAIAGLLPTAGVAGLLVLVFGDGRLHGLIDYVPAGAPHLTAAIGALLAVATISAERSVTYAAASRHERRFGSNVRRAPVRAAALTLPGQAIATVIVAAAAAVLSGSLILPAKEFGLAVAAGAILDLVGVRALMLGGLARLAGR